MNKKIIALAAIALGAISVSAQDAATAEGPSIAGSAGFAYDSLYVFRGVQYAEAIAEPSVNITYGDFYAGLWFALPVKNENSFINEMDATVGYGLALTEMVKLDLGVTHYTYDELPENFFDGPDNTTEFYAGLAFDLPLSPAAYIFRDIDARTSTIEIRAGHSFDLGNSLSLGLSASSGFVRFDEGSNNNYVYYAAAVNLGYAVTEKSSLSIGARLGGSDANLVYGDLKHYIADDFKKAAVWYGVSFTTTF